MCRITDSEYSDVSLLQEGLVRRVKDWIDRPIDNSDKLKVIIDASKIAERLLQRKDELTREYERKMKEGGEQA